VEHPGERGALTLAKRGGTGHAAVRFRAVMLWPAAMFTMMHSWKHQTCIGIRDALSTLGPTYRECLERNSGLPIEENRNLAAGAGTFAEPLRNPSPGVK
jgi:hypothetical protein